MVRLNTVYRWWDHLRVSLTKKLANNGIRVRPLLYAQLSNKEREAVYQLWSYGLWKIRESR